MTRPTTVGHSDPTVQPVPASVVEQVDAADTTLQNPKRAVVSIGSNLGNRLETLQAPSTRWRTPPASASKRSPLSTRRSLGRRARLPAVVLQRGGVLKTTLPPSSLLERAHAIEEAYQRVRDERWGRAPSTSTSSRTPRWCPTTRA